MPRLCLASEIPEQTSRGFQLGDRSIFAVCQDGIIYLYENRCPHLSIALEWLPDQFLDADNEFIQCATHGALFEINSGKCIAGPCVGDALQPVRYRLEDGWILI